MSNNGIAAVFGKWPGDESEAELMASLRELDAADRAKAEEIVQVVGYLREHHDETHQPAATYELLCEYVRGEHVHMPSSCPVFAEIERLRSENAALKARVVELETPTHFWSDLDEEQAHQSVGDFLCASSLGPGEAFDIRPLRCLGEVWYAAVPDPDPDDERDGWANGKYTGDLVEIGPFPTEDAAKAEADRITAEHRAAWEARQGKDGGA